MGEEEEWRAGAEGGLWGESRFGVKSSLVSNYQSLRNAATALTRQAAAWLQRLFSSPTCITDFIDLCTVDAGTHHMSTNSASSVT